LFKFNSLYIFCETKNGGVQNFEPHPIIKKWFKNNRFFHIVKYEVKNYEPNPGFESFPATATARALGVKYNFNYLNFIEKYEKNR
jgi:hypothetical protein